MCGGEFVEISKKKNPTFCLQWSNRLATPDLKGLRLGTQIAADLWHTIVTQKHHISICFYCVF